MRFQVDYDTFIDYSPTDSSAEDYAVVRRVKGADELLNHLQETGFPLEFDRRSIYITKM